MVPVLFHLGPVTLHTYGLMVALGFLCGLPVARVQFRLRGLPASWVDPIVLWLMVAGLFGARLTYYALEGFLEFRVDPWSFFRIWEGGLVFFGGFIGGLTALVILSHRRGVPVLLLTDAFSVPLFLGQALGRLGCFAAGCCYGRATSRPWGVVYSDPQSLAPLFQRLHPTQLYEFFGDLVLFGLAWLLSRKSVRPGTITAFYAVSYGMFRFYMETLRGDDRGAFHYGLSPSQILALGLIALGGVSLAYARKK